jgi:hypothetical protein
MQNTQKKKQKPRLNKMNYSQHNYIIFLMIQNLYSFAKNNNPNPKHEMEYTLNQVPQWNLHKNIENFQQ